MLCGIDGASWHRQQIRRDLEMTETAAPATELFDTAGAADYMRVAGRTLMRWRVEKTGPPYVKLGTGSGGGLVRYRRSDLDAWVGARVQTPAG